MAAAMTAAGRAVLTSLLSGGSPALPAVGAWGLNPQASFASSTDVALFCEAPEARASGGSVVVSQQMNSTTDDTLEWVWTMTAAGAESITECGIYLGTTTPFTGTIASGSSIISSGSGTGLTIASGYSGTLPANGALLQLDTGEVVSVASGGGTTSLVVSRGANQSTISSNAAIGTNVTFGVSPGAYTPTGSALFMHADFTLIGNPLSTGQSIEFTAQVKYI